MPGARELVSAFEAMGVDLLFGGHVHRTHVTTSRDLLPGRASPGIPLIACGTTTSRRGRGSEVGWNSLNIVRIGPRDVEVHPHLLAPDATEFEPGDPLVLPRYRVGVPLGEAAE